MKFRQTIALVCACALTFGIASCSGTDTAESKKSADSKSAQKTESTADNKADSYSADPAALPAEPFTTKCDGSARVTIAENKFMAGNKEIQ